MKRLSALPVTALTVAVVAAVTLSVARPASAVLIKTGVTTLFNDDFEDDTVGLNPAPNFDTGTDPAVPGEWNVTNSFDTVTNALVPGALQGTKYLHAVRPGAIGAYFGSVNSGTVSSTFSVYIPTGSVTDALQISLAASFDANAASGSAPVWLVNDHTGTTNHVYTYVGGVYTDTGLAYLEGQWQTWQLDYTFNPGVDSFALTIPGNPASASFNAGGISGANSNPADLQYLNFRVGITGQTFYIDAVPEPASLGVIGIGALFLTRRRAR